VLHAKYKHYKDKIYDSSKDPGEPYRHGTAVERRPSDLELKIFSSGDIVMVKQHTKQALYVQSIDKLPVASGDRVVFAREVCMVFPDLKLQKSRFSTKDIIKTSQ
jgi:hypothetical protein